MNDHEELKLIEKKGWKNIVGSERYRKWVWRLKQQPLGVIGLLVILIILAMSFLAPWITPFDPLEPDMDSTYQPPNSTHWFGTDEIGRDVFSRVLYGTRLSLSIPIIVLLITIPIGILVGLSSGFLGGRFDNIIMRITDIFLAFPALVLALAIASALGPGLRNAMIAISIIWWPWYARLLRGEVLRVKNEDYVLAAYTIGAKSTRIALKHILPNAFAPILILATLDVGYLILFASGLSFIGLGVQPPTPELGAIISNGRVYMLEYPWIPSFAGLAIFIIAISMNLIGDSLRDILDPKVQGRR